MPTKKNLHLYEEILLLALRDREGTIARGTWYQHALAGALLAELALDGFLELGEKIVSAQVRRTGDELLDETLELIAAAKRPRGLAAWVGKVAGQRQLKRRAAESLCLRGILAADKKRVLRFFERRIYPELDHAPEAAVVERLGKALRSETAVDPRTTALLALAQHTGILAVVFEKKELKRRKARIRRVIEGDAIGRATRQVIDGIQSAILVSVIVAGSV